VDASLEALIALYFASMNASGPFEPNPKSKKKKKKKCVLQ
jgi:hypothetical protein